MVGMEQLKRNFLHDEAINGEPVEFVRALVQMEDAQASFRYRVYLPFPTCHTPFVRSRPPLHTKLLQVTTIWWGERWRLQ